MREEISRAFADARSENRTLLIGYLPVGFPNPRAFAGLLQLASGLDMLELGLPCPDPFMDGPVIRTAMEVLTETGIDMEAAFRLLAEVRPTLRIPLVAMAYWEAVQAFGVERFLDACKRLEISGVLIPDLPSSQLADTCQELQGLGLALVAFLQEPAAAKAFTEATGCNPAFFYLRSSGMTGEAVDVARAAAGLAELKQILNGSATPVALGFGIQTPDDVAALAAAGADAIVVGTVLVKAASQGKPAFRRTVETLASATRREV